MVADGDASGPLFTVENNVLKGRKVSYNTSYKNVGELLLDSMKSAKDSIGQIDAHTDIQDSFADMLDRTIKCALWMKKQGITRGDVIAVSSHNHLDSFVPCVAAACIGAIFNPWDHEMNILLGRHFASVSQPKIIFTNEASTSVALEAFKIETLETKVVVFGDYPGVTSFSDILKGHSKAEVEGFQCEKIENPHDTVVILYSSGTTGPPKGVQLSHYSVVCNLTLSGGGWDLSNQVPLWFTNLYWISGTLLTFQSIACCTKRILFSYFDEEETCKLVEKYKVTWLFLSTSMANRLAKSGYLSRYDVSTLGVVFTGGALLKRESQEELQKYVPDTSVLQAYGLTELGGIGCKQLRDTSVGSCGIVAFNVKLKIVDIETGKTLGPKQNGEIYIKAPTMTRGYYKNPEATKQTIDEEGWLHTGDLAYYNEKGEVFIIDRIKELIKYRGKQVSPGDIENILSTHPAVMEVAVVGIPHPTEDEHPIAFVKVLPGQKVTAQELIDLVENTLMDHHKLRGGVKFIDKFPTTPTGKIARKEVKAMAKSLVCY